jgi:nucleoside-diphosphate-sugar epimerase
MRILVTGGQGFLGGALARALVAQGYTQITATARRAAPDLEALGIKVEWADLRDREAALAVTEGQDLIFHTAAKAGVWGAFSEYHAINTQATAYLLEGARQNGVSYFVHTSSPSVTFAGRSEIDVDETAPYSGKPLNGYCFTKIASEMAVLACDSPRKGLRTLALRPHLIYGPGDPHLLPRVFEAAARNRLVRVGNGLNRVDVTHIDDAVAAHLAVLTSLKNEEIWGKPYFVTSGRPVLLWDWLDALLGWKGLPPVRRSVGLRAAVAVGAVMELAYRLLRFKGEPPLTRFSALQLGCSHTYSIEQARNLLGYAPAIDPYSSFDQQLRKADGSGLQGLATREENDSQ